MRIARQELNFGITVPASGNAVTTAVLELHTADGGTHRLGVVHATVPKILEGPARVTLEVTIAVPEPPPPNLRDRLIARLVDNEAHGVDGQVDAVLALLSESPNLLDELDALTDDDD